MDFRTDEPLGPFLDHLHGFIYKQHIFEDRQAAGHAHPWPGSEWNHGPRGHLQWLAEQLGDLDPAAVGRMMPYLTTASLAGNKRCPCGSGAKARDCHASAIQRVRRAAREVPDVLAALETLVGSTPESRSGRSSR